MIVYKTENLVDGKIYVGKYEGERTTYLGSGIYLKRAIFKYGKENFKRTTIDISEDRRELCLKEIFWINFYDSKNSEIGYNISDGGDGFNGHHSYETRQKIGIFHKGKFRSEETKKKISQGRKEYLSVNPIFFSEETRQKISASNSGENNGFYGKKHSKETKQKMSESRKRRVYDQ